jgi:DNA-binding NarL/FixJ family response regulator
MNTPGTITVLIADDEALFRSGIRLLLEAQDGIEVVGEAVDGRHALALAGQLRPDVVLMDIQMPELDGIAATDALVSGGSDARVLVLTTFDLDKHVYDALAVGAAGFLLKSARPARLVEAIRSVAEGDALLDPTLTRRLISRWVSAPLRPADDTRIARLTERELEVLALVGRGLTNKEIAAELYLGESTVKTHVVRVLAKTRSRDRVQAVILAHETGLATRRAGTRCDVRRSAGRRKPVADSGGRHLGFSVPCKTSRPRSAPSSRETEVPPEPIPTPAHPAPSCAGCSRSSGR